MTKLIPLSYGRKSVVAVLCCIVLLSNVARAQGTVPGNESAKLTTTPGPVILSHYTTTELADIQATDSLKYKSIFYYYQQSFIVEPFNCADCVNQERLIHFDVSLYEEFRKKSQRYSRVFEKYGFKITLLAIDELTYKLPIHQRP